MFFKSLVRTVTIHLKTFGSFSRLREYYGTTIFVCVLAMRLAEPNEKTLTLLLILSALLTMCFSFMINDLEDYQDDAKDAVKALRNPISAGQLSLNTGKVLVISTAFLSLIFLIPFGVTPIILAVSGLFVGFLYSSKKIRLKSTPFIDVLSHGYFLWTIQFITTYVALTRVNILPFLPLLAAIFIFAASILGSLRSQIRDLKVDRKANITNTVSIISINDKKLLLSKIYSCVAITLGVILFTSLNTYTWIIIIPVMLYIGIAYYKWTLKGSTVFINPNNQKILIFLSIFAFFAN